MCVHAKSLQSYQTLCDPVDCSLPGFSVHGVSRQEYWSGLPCPPPGDLTDPGIEPTFPVASVLQVDSLPLSHREAQVPSVDSVKHILKKKKNIYIYIYIFKKGNVIPSKRTYNFPLLAASLPCMFL